MTTIKSYTDLEQSKRLAEFLPIESADMGWNVFVDETTRILPIDDWDLVRNGSGNVKFYPAWSLAALLELIRNFQPNYQSALFVGKENDYLYMSSIDSTTHEYNNPVDACYEMILKLHEQKLL